MFSNNVIDNNNSNNNNSPVVLVGDFNMPFEKLKTYISKNFLMIKTYFDAYLDQFTQYYVKTIKKIKSTNHYHREWKDLTSDATGRSLYIDYWLKCFFFHNNQLLIQKYLSPDGICNKALERKIS
ncbi:hypothetical protein H8356DRAFT_1347613 [Neocallimastix lanati (nom. inval.)]|nr:hypothetical protein H8356DRAFT_1347613 [Neocallimastix sp. JGI-2020a]